MEQLHTLISDVLFNTSPLIRDFFIFILAYIEGLPVITIFFPGAMIAIIIGSFTGTGEISPFLAINLIAIGSFLGDLTSLYIGPKLLKISWFKKFVEKEDYQKYWTLFEKHIAWIIIFGKLIPFVKSTPSLFAGARNISKTKYFIYALIGSYLWSIVGIYGGNVLSRIFGKSAVFVIFLIFLVLGIGTYVFKKIRK